MTGEPQDTLVRADGSAPLIQVVDDEEVLLDLLRDALRFAGYRIITASTGLAAVELARKESPDLLVLDVNLPDIDGFEVCRRLRADGSDIAVVFLTARDDTADLRTGFTTGGDDYVTKPFSLEELNLRIRAILRRNLSAARPNRRLLCGPLVLDDDQHRVWSGEREVDLSPTEYRLLRYLLANSGIALSKMQILDHVWNYDFDGDASVVETYVSYLRRKLGEEGQAVIRTVRGVGYSARAPE